MEDDIPLFVGIGLDKEIEQVVIVAMSQEKSDCVKKCKARFRGRPIFVWGFEEDPLDIAENITAWLIKNDVPKYECANIISMVSEEIEKKVMSGGRID